MKRGNIGAFLKVVLLLSTTLAFHHTSYGALSCKSLLYQSKKHLLLETLEEVEQTDKNISAKNYAIQALHHRALRKRTIEPLVHRLIRDHAERRSELALLQKKENLAFRSIDNEVVIIGGGPLGLLSGLLAFKSGKSVRVIEKREVYTRDEIMGLDPVFFDFLKLHFPELISEMLALDILIARPGWQDLKEGGMPDDNFYSVRIQQLEYSLALLYESLQEGFPGAPIQLLKQHSFEQLSSDLSTFVVHANTQKEKKVRLRARIVIGADGFSGPSTRLIPSKSYSNHHPTIKALFRAESLTEALEFSTRRMGKSLRENLNAPPQKESLLAELKSLGWQPEELNLAPDALPSLRIFQNSDHFYIASTLSPRLAHFIQQEPKIGREWFLALAKYIFPRSEAPHLILRGETLGHIAPELRALNDPILFGPAPNKTQSLFVALGDRAANGHYMTRSGINSGARHVMSLYQSIFPLAPHQLQGATLQEGIHSYRKTVQDQFSQLLAKASSRKHFVDAKFINLLSPPQEKIAQSLQEAAGLTHVYFEHIQALQLAGYRNNFLFHRLALEKAAASTDPNNDFDGFLQVLSKNLYTGL